MKKLLQQLAKDESGAALIEYVLIAALVAIATIVSMKATATSVDGVWTAIQGALNGAAGGGAGG